MGAGAREHLYNKKSTNGHSEESGEQWGHFKEMGKWSKNDTILLESQLVPPTSPVQSPVLDKPTKTGKLIMKTEKDLFKVVMLESRTKRLRDHFSSYLGS